MHSSRSEHAYRLLELDLKGEVSFLFAKVWIIQMRAICKWANHGCKLQVCWTLTGSCLCWQHKQLAFYVKLRNLPTLALQPSVCDSEHHSQMRQTVKHEALLEYSRAAVKSTENLIHFVEQQMLLRFITNEWEGHKWGGVSQEVSCIDLCFHCGRLPEFILCLYSGVNFSFSLILSLIASV